MGRSSILLLFFVVLLGSVLSVYCATVNSIRVSLLRSWSCIGGTQLTAWNTLHGVTPYGPVDIKLNTNSTCAVITTSLLDKLKPDVIVLSDSAGGLQQASPSEMKALLNWSIAHNTLIVGTYNILDWRSVDDETFDPLFGLSSNISILQNDTGLGSALPFRIRDPTNCLFKNLTTTGNTLQLCSGFPASVRPSSGQWHVRNFRGASIVAEYNNFEGVITLYRTGTFNSIWVSCMSDYQSSNVDLQFLYNLITWNNTQYCPSS